MLLFLTCQGMATASTPRGIAFTPSNQTQMAAMPGCHLMKSTAKTPAVSDSDCQSIAEAFHNGTVTGLVWAPMPALPSWALPLDGTEATLPAAALPAHDPIVDPPPTLRLHRFLE